MSNAYEIGSHDVLIAGSVRLDGRAFLAPLSGVTDIGMRRIARRFGAAMVVSEMVAADGLVRGAEEARVRADGEGLDLHVVQIAGREPGPMAEAARLAEGAGAHMVDINMGCPAKKVVGGYAGAALMRDPDRAAAIVAAVVAAVRVPVSVKMRLGWSRDAVDAPALARRAEAEGAVLLTVHGRTRDQFYAGRADWAAIGAVSDAVRIPVIANGDCLGADDARQMLALSGARGVMIGRAAVGRPWIVGEISRALAGRAGATPSWAERAAAAAEHYDSLLTNLGIEAGVRHARKHLDAYALHAGAPEALRRALVTSIAPREVLGLLGQAFADPVKKAA